MLMATSERALQGNLNIWNEVLQEKGMKINKTKTKVMVMGEKIINIEIGGVKIEQVKQFKYLGVIVDSNW